MISQAHYESAFGVITIGYSLDTVVSIQINTPKKCPHTPAPVTEIAAGQLLEYFQSRRTVFDFPIRLEGTAFQKSVWEELMKIPYGKTRTYSQIAAAIGRPKAARAVGMACNRNPIWIAIPCHRVVGKDASLTGYAGGLSMKQKLLELEQAHYEKSPGS